MVPEEPKPSWLLKQFHTECLFFFFLLSFWWKESLFTVWMSQVNPIPRSNGISDGEQIALRWCWTGQETLEEKKNAHFYTIEDTGFIFAVSRVFIIDFPLRHNGRPIMKGLSFLFLCVVPWWGQWLKVAGAHLWCRSHCSLRNSGWSSAVEVTGKSSRYQKYI